MPVIEQKPRRHSALSLRRPELSKLGGVQTTRRSVVREAGGESGPERARLALAELSRDYREPAQAFIEELGYSESDADALSTRFFETLERDGALRSALDSALPFREWLLERLKEFLFRLDSDPGPAFVAAPASRGGAQGPASASSARAGTAVCASCGAPSASLDSLGVCASCLFEHIEREHEPAIARYEILEELGQGGEGVVYRAWDLQEDRQVALKILKEEYCGQPGVVQRFRKEVALAATLEHPHIARIYDKSGLADEPPFYTMQLLPGGTLAQPERQARFRDPVLAARLMVTVARAVHHAHQHGVLHRDLSPANILLDLNDEPYVCDFMAKRIGQPGPSGAVGKFNYAAPEQAVGEGATVEADVYGLGAVLHELLTGRPPLKARSFEDVLRQHEQGALRSARQLVPSTPRDLDAICRAALSREPANRHGSAALFAESLERVLETRAPLWPQVSRRRRAWLWARRNPLLALGAFVGAGLLLIADFATVASVRSEQRELETGVLYNNAALASAQARAVLTSFEKYASQTARAAIEPEVREFLARGEIADSVSVAERLFDRSRSLDSVSLFSPDGRILAHFPDLGPGGLGRDFRFRKYYQCIRSLSDGPRQGAVSGPEPVCISPAYRGEIMNGIQFTFAAPVHDASGRCVGFVMMSRYAKRTLDEVEISDAYQSGQTTALLGHRDRDRHSLPRFPGMLTVVAHPDLFSMDEEYTLPRELSMRLEEQFGEEGAPGLQLRPINARPLVEAGYVDPVTGQARLAGFAPVGATGFVVAVSTPRERALGASQRHVESLSKYALLLNLGFLILAVVAVWSSLRDRPASGARR